MRLLAALVLQRGNWQESESYFSEAKRLDPRNTQLLFAHAGSLMFQRRFDEAQRELEQALNITPDDMLTLVQAAGIAQAQGDLKRAAALLDPLPLTNSNVREAKCYQALLERNPSQMILKINEMLSTNSLTDPGDRATTRGSVKLFVESISLINSLTDPGDRATTRGWLGWLEEVTSDHAAALENWRQAR